jgi:hypothetical protein
MLLMNKTQSTYSVAHKVLHRRASASNWKLYAYVNNEISVKNMYKIKNLKFLS